MIKIPVDEWGNRGWAVKARKEFMCEGWQPGRRIRVGEFYYRCIAFPGTDPNYGTRPMVVRLCRDCLNDHSRALFDAALNHGIGAES